MSHFRPLFACHCCKFSLDIYHFFLFFSDEKKTSLSDTPKFGAFADINKKNIEPDIIIPDIPFSKLIISYDRPSQDSSSPPPSSKDDEDCSKTILLEDQNGNSPTEKPKAALTLKPTNDDFIMVELVNFFLLMGACLLTKWFRAHYICLLLVGEGKKLAAAEFWNHIISFAYQ